MKKSKKKGKLKKARRIGFQNVSKYYEMVRAFNRSREVERIQMQLVDMGVKLDDKKHPLVAALHNLSKKRITYASIK